MWIPRQSTTLFASLLFPRVPYEGGVQCTQTHTHIYAINHPLQLLRRDGEAGFFVPPNMPPVWWRQFTLPY